ncbi:MAG: FecR family protein [Treponema sp.]|nr:FecR family protein [Treponema sp.]
MAVAVTGAVAQENPAGRIFYVDGSEFTLIIEGHQEIYGPGVLNVSEMSLGNGDMIRTGPNSFLELQLLPDGTGIKIAENTSVQLTWQEDGLPEIVVSYGRIRVVVGLQARDPALYVRAENGVIGVRKGDLCFDYVISEKDSPNDEEEFLKPKLHVYNFRGFSEMALSGGTGTGASLPVFQNDRPVIPVNERESVSLEVNASLALIERKPLDMGVAEYWSLHNFRGTPPLPLPDTSLVFDAAAPVVTAAPQTQPAAAPEPKYDFTASQRRLTQIKNALIISGLTLTAAGITAQAIGYAVLSPNNPASARTQVNFGFIPIGIGISAVIASLFFNPAFP